MTTSNEWHQDKNGSIYYGEPEIIEESVTKMLHDLMEDSGELTKTGTATFSDNTKLNKILKHLKTIEKSIKTLSEVLSLVLELRTKQLDNKPSESAAEEGTSGKR